MLGCVSHNNEIREKSLVNHQKFVLCCLCRLQDACEHYDITIWELDVAYENQTQLLHIDMK